MSKESCEFDSKCCNSKCSKKCCTAFICATVAISAITALIVVKIASCNMYKKTLDKQMQIEVLKNIVEIKSELKAGKMIVPPMKGPIMKTMNTKK